MSEQKAKGYLIAAVLWLAILAVVGVSYKFLLQPRLKKKVKEETSSASQYRWEINIGADSFSGYALLRSEAVRNELRLRQVKLNFIDDKADYNQRLKDLRDGKLQMGVFTIDSLLTTGAKEGDFPGAIILVLDETKGGDAIIAYESGVSEIQKLNDPAARIVYTPNSPSEFLSRVVLAHFDLPRLSPQWGVAKDGAREVYETFKRANPQDKTAYVLWEPYISKAMQIKGAKRLLDSSQLRGYIVDVLVARREFLRENAGLAQQLVEAYLRAVYQCQRKEETLVDVLVEDARLSGAEVLDKAQAKQVAQSIQWKNTLENYAHFGLLNPAEAAGIQHLEDIIGNIVKVLLRTKALEADPLNGQYNTLFYQNCLAQIRAKNFHPGSALDGVSGALAGQIPGEKLRTEAALPQMNPEQWKAMRPVGELKIEPIVFLRGSSQLSGTSQRDLAEAAAQLQNFPRFYLRIIGHARPEGDPEANRQLAQARADAVAQTLAGLGLHPHRLNAETALASLTGGEAQAVTFLVVQAPY